MLCEPAPPAVNQSAAGPFQIRVLLPSFPVCFPKDLAAADRMRRGQQARNPRPVVRLFATWRDLAETAYWSGPLTDRHSGKLYFWFCRELPPVFTQTKRSRPPLQNAIDDDGQVIRAHLRSAPEACDENSRARQRMIDLDAGGRQKSRPRRLPAEALRRRFEIAVAEQRLKMWRKRRHVQITQNDERPRVGARELADERELSIAQGRVGAPERPAGMHVQELQIAPVDNDRRRHRRLEIRIASQHLGLHWPGRQQQEPRAAPAARRVAMRIGCV